jgi:hypothetical protein
MNWAFSFSGNKDAIATKFDEERDKAAGYGMIEAEQRDIDEVRDFVVQIASEYGEVSGSTSGHWNLQYGELVEATADRPAHRPIDSEKSTFGQITVTISKGAAS